MFLWSILQKSESELVRKVFDVQLLNPVKNDLCLQFIDDLKQCGINLTMPEISVMKKSKFKKLVNSQLREASRDYLMSLKSSHSKHSKMKNNYNLQSYLTSDNLSVEEKQTLFQLRTRSTDVKSNFKSQHGSNLQCQFCDLEEDQPHLLLCKEISRGVDTSGVEHDDIFGRLTKQENAARVFQKLFRRKILLMKTL